MASKKPAKPMAGQSKVVHQDPSIYGQPYRFLGFPSCPSTCGICGKKTVRGMIRIKNDKPFCSAGCAHRDYILKTQESTDISM